ncbi:DNA-binding protein [Yersinia ruckeri]|uniref:YmfL family putative regulatory protein n=2 Tax=Yersinia ruckeri TaxID=29486 RepID=UPI0005EA907B|nr:YmfL family putative regulatory protein [Yersinia ruckeri]AKA37728.1 DNA-binding protein [Yersinia ruckeri]EKN4687705.1 DNA-binding protein [Yersinia ruckeri]EKN4691733.1 DNA-binding protein [Yersinia ruckeri]ELI6453492.1 DNA-binding protein [Yersinia ruckeri]MCW6563821.1 DNA-binding protein [Yersinia ruckeri]
MDNRDFPTQSDISEAMHQLITQTPGKYERMAKELCPVGGTENALRNRVRQLGGQVVPLGMAVEMESISGRTDITQAMCKRAGGVFVKLPDVTQMGNEELLIKFNELLAALGEFGRAHNEFTADGVLDRQESKRLKAKGYRAQSIIAEILVVTELLWGDATDSRSVASGALTKQCGVINA